MKLFEKLFLKIAPLVLFGAVLWLSPPFASEVFRPIDAGDSFFLIPILIFEMIFRAALLFGMVLAYGVSLTWLAGSYFCYIPKGSIGIFEKLSGARRATTLRGERLAFTGLGFVHVVATAPQSFKSQSACTTKDGAKVQITLSGTRAVDEGRLADLFRQDGADAALASARVDPWVAGQLDLLLNEAIVKAGAELNCADLVTPNGQVQLLVQVVDSVRSELLERGIVLERLAADSVSLTVSNS